MNTKTMRLPPRRVLTHATTSGASSSSSTKRKERQDDIDAIKTKSLKPTPQADEPPPASSNNHLLAGYLAHEYLTKGTLFGEPWDPARAEAVPVKAKPIRRVEAEPSKEAEQQRYLEVANLLKTDGAHLPGIVNPTYLARFLQM